MTTLLTLNKHNKNGRIYHKDTMQAAIDKHLASNKPMMIEHPVEFPFHTPHVNIERCVGQVKNLQIEDNFLLGDISFFKDQEMYEGFSVVPKGIGSVGEDGVVTDYTLISFSLTDDPAWASHSIATKRIEPSQKLTALSKAGESKSQLTANGSHTASKITGSHVRALCVATLVKNTGTSQCKNVGMKIQLKNN